MGSPTASPTSLTYRAPDGQELSNDETMKEILDKFEGVEIDFEDEKYLITGPTEMVHQVYEEMIEAFGEAEGEEEENKEEEEKKENQKLLLPCMTMRRKRRKMRRKGGKATK